MLRSCNVLFQTIDLITKPGVVCHQPSRLVSHLLDLSFQRVFFLLLAIDATRKVCVLCLLLADLVVHVGNLFFCLFLRLLSNSDSLLDFFVFLLKNDRLLLGLRPLLFSQHLSIALHGDFGLQILSLTLKRKDLFIPVGILGFLLLQLDLIQSQRVHECIDFVSRLTAPVSCSFVFLLELLICAFCCAECLLEGVCLDLHALHGQFNLAPLPLESRAPLFITFELLPQSINLCTDLFNLILESIGLSLQLFFSGLLFVDSVQIF
mmetsp:Transcript_46716/g.117627  ORF Transcript_46716/g.117627 Transcript_46716/m.117627 type:complete len:264 (+) Transcript_46716:1566-2357(+)